MLTLQLQRQRFRLFVVLPTANISRIAPFVEMSIWIKFFDIVEVVFRCGLAHTGTSSCVIIDLKIGLEKI